MFITPIRNWSPKMLARASEGQVVQYLVPLLSGTVEAHKLVGLLNIPLTKFKGKEQKLTVDLPGNMSRTLVAQCIEYSTQKSSRKLFCILFEHTSGTGHDPWNGLPNVISIKDLGIVSAWATPVANPDYHRESLGLCELFISNKLDHLKDQNKQQSITTQQISLQLKVSVPYDRLCKKMSYIELDWLPAFTKYCTRQGLHVHPLQLTTVDWPTQFKVMAYTNSTSSGVPNIIRIMRIVPSDQTVYNFMFDVNCTDNLVAKIVLQLSVNK